MIKLLATDLDGTLLTDEKTISEIDARAMAEAKEKGVQIAVCSGRGYPGFIAMMNRLDEKSLGRYHCALNGGMIYDIREKRIVESFPVGKEKILGTLAIGRQLLDEINIQLYTETEILVERRDESSAVYERLDKAKLRTVSNLDDYADRAIKVIFVLKQTEALRDMTEMDRFGGIVKPLLPGGLAICHSNTYLLEIIGEGCNKASGLRRIRELYGLCREETAAIGDNDNDLPLLSEAGLAFAVGNAEACAKEKADYVCEQDNNHGAVAEAITRWILQ